MFNYVDNVDRGYYSVKIVDLECETRGLVFLFKYM